MKKIHLLFASMLGVQFLGMIYVRDFATAETWHCWIVWVTIFLAPALFFGSKKIESKIYLTFSMLTLMVCMFILPRLLRWDNENCAYTLIEESYKHNQLSHYWWEGWGLIFFSIFVSWIFTALIIKKFGASS